MSDARKTNNNGLIGSKIIEQLDLEFTRFDNLNWKIHKLSVEKRLEIIDEVVGKITRIMVDNSELSFTTEECKKYISCARSLSCDADFGGAREYFFEKFFNALCNCITTVVIPSLRGKRREELLAAFLETWNKYKKMSSYLVKIFRLLDISLRISLGTPVEAVPALMICSVFDALWTTTVKDTIISMIKQERDEQLKIDQDLIKRIIEFCLETENMKVRQYYTKLEGIILSETTDCYSKLASEWLESSTFGDYIKKAWLCYEKEKRQKECYFNEDLMIKLLRTVKGELIDKRATEVAWLIPAMGLGLVKLMPMAEE